MIIPGSGYWNIGIGRNEGEVEHDEEGLRTMEALGQDMAWLLKKINTGCHLPRQAWTHGMRETNTTSADSDAAASA